jgi:hypothetical protein
MKPKGATTVLVLALIFSLAAVQFGCDGRISQKSFQKIENGMTEDEVTKILGEPTESASLGVGGFSGTTSTWKGEGGTIAIQFMNGKVAMKTFTKGE